VKGKMKNKVSLLLELAPQDLEILRSAAPVHVQPGRLGIIPPPDVARAALGAVARAILRDYHPDPISARLAPAGGDSSLPANVIRIEFTPNQEVV
jgi:hypothetical protein